MLAGTTGSQRRGASGPIRSKADDGIVSVIGDTGDFAGANGTLTWSNDAQGRRLASFDIRCVR